ncbi:MAG TPA: carboxypeptidase regulatory-like domain-containing protein [Blastocatellia bacterium]|nr:carboxypeptidase regulatory-like domain-containing protein [Blastocatellia bacterium]
MNKVFCMRGSAKLMLGILMIAMWAVVGFGQENSGSIQGTVKDTTGAAIPGVKVLVTGPSLVRPLETTSDKEGNYVFPKIPSGVYTVTISNAGFKTMKTEDVQVMLGQAAKIDVALSAGDVAESVTVTTGTELIDVTSSKVATNITEQFMDSTPKGRNFDSLLIVAPGVRSEPKSGSFGVGGFQINGASGSENTFVVDGVAVSDVRRGGLRANDSIPFEFLREVQVKSAGFEAEYGGTLGGVVNVATKSGSDEYHGMGFLYLTGSSLNSAPRSRWQRNPGDQTQAEYFTPKEDSYRNLFPGFTLGGPIIKQRLNFFAGYSPEERRTDRTVSFTSDGSTRTSTRRVLQHYGIARLDYLPTQKIQVNSSFFWNPQRTTGSIFASTDGRQSIPANDLSITGGYVPASNFTTSFNYTPTSKLILSVRYGYKYLNDKADAYGKSQLPYLITQQPSLDQNGNPVLPGIPTQYLATAGSSNVTNTFTTNYDITTRHNIYLDANYLTRFFGQHSFKGGYAINRIANRVRDDYPDGRFDIYWNDSFTRLPGEDGQRGIYGYYIWEDGVRHNAQVNSRNQAFYIQDAWQVRPGLTVNAGVRLENEFLPPYLKVVDGRNVANPISFGWGDKVAPLLGFAWDIKGNGKWKLSAGYGQYFDLMKYELARGSFGGDFWHSHVYTLDNPNLGMLSKSTPGALGTQILDIDNRTLPINAQGEIEGVDPGAKPMSVRQFNMGLDHEFKQGLVGSVRWTHSRLVRGIEDIGTLNDEGSEVYIIGNPGFGLTNDQALGLSGQPLVPKARRDYDGVEFRVDGRFSGGLLRRFNYNASYTYSRLYGNWAGLANSDEDGRSDPNVSRAYDLFYSNYDSSGRNAYGLLATDRPHTFKFFGSYDKPWKKGGSTTFSFTQLAYSGTPLSSTATVIVPVFFNGRGDLGRTPTMTQTNLLIYHSVNVSERVKMRFDLNVTNLFNQAAMTNINPNLYRNGSANPTLEQFFGGFNARNFIKPDGINPETGLPYGSPNINPIYGRPTTYQGGRELRLGFRFEF